jgi:hypothetical protein
MMADLPDRKGLMLPIEVKILYSKSVANASHVRGNTSQKGSEGGSKEGSQPQHLR